MQSFYAQHKYPNCHTLLLHSATVVTADVFIFIGLIMSQSELEQNNRPALSSLHNENVSQKVAYYVTLNNNYTILYDAVYYFMYCIAVYNT